MRVASGRESGVKPKGKSSCKSQKRLPYRIGQGLGSITIASSAVNLQGTVGKWTTVGQRQRRKGGQLVQRKRDKRKVRSVGLKFGTLNRYNYREK